MYNLCYLSNIFHFLVIEIVTGIRPHCGQDVFYLLGILEKGKKKKEKKTPQNCCAGNSMLFDLGRILESLEEFEENTDACLPTPQDLGIEVS